MTATQLLTWTEAANDRTEFKATTKLVALYRMPGDESDTVFEIVRTNGSRHRLYVAGQKDGADTEGADQVNRTKERAEAALAEALSVLAEVQAEAAAETTQTVEAPEFDGLPAVTADAEPHLGELDDTPVMDEPSEPRETVEDEIARLRAERAAQQAAEDAEWNAGLDAMDRLAAGNGGVAAEVVEVSEPAPAVIRPDATADEVSAAMFGTVPAPKVEKVKAPKKEKAPAAPKADRELVNGEPLMGDGWTKKRAGVHTFHKTGKASVDGETGFGDWQVWIEGVVVNGDDGKPRQFKTMKAAKEYADAALQAAQ